MKIKISKSRLEKIIREETAKLRKEIFNIFQRKEKTQDAHGIDQLLVADDMFGVSFDGANRPDLKKVILHWLRQMLPPSGLRPPMHLGQVTSEDHAVAYMRGDAMTYVDDWARKSLSNWANNPSSKGESNDIADHLIETDHHYSDKAFSIDDFVHEINDMGHILHLKSLHATPMVIDRSDNVTYPVGIVYWSLGYLRKALLRYKRDYDRNAERVNRQYRSDSTTV